MAANHHSFAMMVGNLRFRMAPRLGAAGIHLKWNSANLRDSAVIQAEHALSLLRIMQEALSNALKHSRANNIAVIVSSDEHHLQIKIQDDGQGFDPTHIQRGKGMAGMARRARSIGAELDVLLGGGTTVIVKLPLELGAAAVADSRV
jgi:signal transduction histidine kinase